MPLCRATPTPEIPPMRRFSRTRARSLPTPPVMTLDPDRPNRARRLWSGLVEAIDTLVFPLACRVCGADGLVAPFCAGCRAELVEASAGSRRLKT